MSIKITVEDLIAFTAYAGKIRSECDKLLDENLVLQMENERLTKELNDMGDIED